MNYKILKIQGIHEVVWSVKNSQGETIQRFSTRKEAREFIKQLNRIEKIV